MNSHTYPSQPAKPLCRSTGELLQSLKLGQRVQLHGPNDSTETYFEPHLCMYQWFSREDLCEIASRFYSITLAGDSHTRHHVQATFMALAGDLVLGGLYRDAGEERFGVCKCDGQFSENGQCRGAPRMPRTSLSYGLCSAHPSFRVRYAEIMAGRSMSASKLFQSSDFCSEDPRPRFIVLQCGAHTGVNAPNALKLVVGPFMAQLSSARSACKHQFPVKVVFTGMNSQAGFLDRKYPSQTVENSIAFNEEMAQAVWTAYEMDSLDFVNLTKNASVSDGYHYLTEVNALKAMYTFNVMNLWRQ